MSGKSVPSSRMLQVRLEPASFASSQPSNFQTFKPSNVSLSPLFATHPKNTPASPIIATHTKNTGGWSPLTPASRGPAPQFVPTLHSWRSHESHKALPH